MSVSCSKHVVRQTVLAWCQFCETKLRIFSFVRYILRAKLAKVLIMYKKAFFLLFCRVGMGLAIIKA